MTVQKQHSSDAFKNGKTCFSFLFDDGFDYVTQNPRTKEIWIGGGDVCALVSASEYLGICDDGTESIKAKSHLLGVLQSVFPTGGNAELLASWSGVMCFSIDKAPLVGRLHQQDDPEDQSLSGQYISAGYGGYGMVNAFLCGKALAHLVLKGSLPAWLPAPYHLTVDRMRVLQRKVQGRRDRPREGLEALL